MAEIDMGNLYDFNKANYNEQTPLDPIFCNKKIDEVGEWMRSFKYVMLLCRERNDYTIFKICKSKEKAPDVLKECLFNRGQVLDIIQQEDGNYEIWIKDFNESDSFCYYLFNYGEGVIEVE